MLLQVAELEAGYGRKRVIHDVTLEVGEGEIVAVLGHNGAAKSTLLNAIFGIVAPTRGRVMFRGRDITGQKPSNNLREGIGYAPQGAEVFKTLSVTDNLMLGGFCLKDQKQVAESVQRVQALFPALHARRQVRAGALSGGERRMLSLGMLLVASPSLVMLDEPSGGLSPLMVESMYAAIREVAAKLNASVLLIEQDTKHALSVASKVYVLANGRVTFKGVPGELEDGAALSQLLLGY